MMRVLSMMSTVLIATVAPNAAGAAAPQGAVVLDPGHGGENLGTQAAARQPEKRIVLEVVRSAAETLRRQGVEVIMTRQDDRHVPIAERRAMATRPDVRAFVSVHANYSPVTERRGVECYVLSSGIVSEEETAIVTQEEHEPGAGEGRAPEVPLDAGGATELMLGELLSRHALEQSGRLARMLHDRIAAVPALGPPRGLRQAPFAVLKGLWMPAVLVELGYLSNQAQAQFLSTAAGQRAAGRAIASAVLAFVRDGQRHWAAHP